MRKLLLFAFLLFYFWDGNAQECGFVEPQNYQTYDDFNDLRISNTSSATQNYCINVCFRILRDNNGTNPAINPSVIPQILAQMNSKFNPHGITFYQVGTYDYINNTMYNNSIGNNTANIPTNIPNCINIYFIKQFLDPNIGGTASSQQLTAKIKGSQAFKATTHEIGHILKLLHTFYCSDVPALSCTDSPLNSNDCNMKGDLVCDTPADYNPLNYNSSNPPPYPINSYHPDKTNIMSYWPNTDHFTTVQGERMQNAILGAPELQSIRSYQCAKINAPTIFCGSGIFTISGASFGTPTFSWSVMGNLEIVGSSTNPTVNIKRWSPSDSGGLVSVIINGTITRTISITPKCNAVILGKYDWVSKDYGNMGLIVPINPEEETITSYIWEIKEDENATNNEGKKPNFVGSATNEPLKYTSNSNQAIVNWGSCSGSYFLSCYGVSASGEQFLIDEGYVDVGDPKNNPCFKNAIQYIISPNPVKNGKINVVVIKPENTTPCNYKNSEEPQFFNSELDRVNNSITIFDYNGNEVYRNVFESNEFTIENVNLVSGDNYVVNLFTNEGGFRQQIIIAE